MICILHNKENDKLINEYAKIIGSKEAAYYVLACNNGYELEFDNEGNTSYLFEDLMIKHKNDKDAAIREKALIYSSDFNGTEWWNESDGIEPSIDELNDYVGYKSKKTEFIYKDLFQESSYHTAEQSLAKTGIRDKQQCARVAVDLAKQNYINSEIDAFKEGYKDSQKTKFWYKVRQFFTSKHNKGKIKNPDKKKINTIRTQSENEFNETLRHIAISKLISELSNSNIGHMLEQAYDNNDTILLNTIINTIYGKIFFGSNYDVKSKLDQTRKTTINDATITDIIDNPNIDTLHILDIINLYNSVDPSYINRDVDAYNTLLQGAKSRLISAQRSSSSNKQVIFNIKNKLTKLEGIDINDIKEVPKMWYQFLESAQRDLQNCLIWCEQVKNNGLESLNVEHLSYIYTDVLGHYQYIIDQYLSKLDIDSNMQESDILDIQDQYNTSISQLMDAARSEFNKVLTQYADNIIDTYIDENVGVGDIDLFKINAKLWIRNKINGGDVQSLETFCGMASCSSSPIVRIIANMFDNTANEVNRKTNVQAHKLVHLFKKSTLKSSDLAEFDSEGMPTGNIVRDINYGQFELDRQRFVDSLCKRFKLYQDENGKPQFNFNTKKGLETYNKYMDLMDDWLEDHANRRFVSEYYKQRRKHLSKETIDAVEELESKIQSYKDKYTDNDGVFHKEQMSNSDRNDFEFLSKQKEELSNPYIISQDPITKKFTVFNSKQGDDLKIATELQQWYKYLQDKVEYEPDVDKYNEALSKITDPIERQRFIQENTVTRINSIFYEILGALSTTEKTEEGEFSSYSLKKIINTTKERKGYTNPNILLLNDESLKEIKELETEIKQNRIKTSNAISFTPEIYEYLLNHGFSEERIKNLSVNDIAQRVAVTMVDDNGKVVSIYEYLYNKAKADLQTNPNALDEFFEKYHKDVVVNGMVRSTPLDIFFNIAPRFTDMIETVPTGQFSKLKKSSSFVNSNFDDTQKKSIQPIRSKYTNPAFDKIKKSKENMDVYNEIIKMNEETNSYLPTSSNTDAYRACQVTDRGGKIFARSMMAGDITNACFGSIKQYFTVTEKDTDISDFLSTRPDGSIVQNIPIRYVHPLQDRRKVSTDIIGSSILYYHMGQNFNEKSKILPIAEMLYAQTKGGIGGKEKNTQIERIKQYLDMYGYEREQTGFGGSSKKMSTAEKTVIKNINNFRRLAIISMLANKLFPMVKGFTSGLWNLEISAFSNRHFSQKDLFSAFKDCIKDAPGGISSIGTPNTNSKIQALMQRCGLSKDITQSFSKQDMNRTTRLFYDNMLMGGYSLGDYITTSVAMTAIFKNYRLVYNPITDQDEFMNKDQVIDTYTKSGRPYKQALFNYNNSKHSLFDAYELDDTGVAIVKDKFKHLVTKRLENLVANTTRERSAVINGVVPETGKSKIYSNAFLRLLTVMRGYLFSTGWDLFKNAYDFVGYTPDEFGQYKRNKKQESGMYNFSSGRIERGVYRNFATTLGRVAKVYMSNLLSYLKFNMTKPGKKEYKRLSQQDKGSIRQIIGSVLGFYVASVLANMIFIPLAQDDDESWWKNFVALTSIGTVTELATPLSIFTIMDIINQPTTVYSYISTLGRVGNLLLDTFHVDNKSNDDIIKKGAYKGKTRQFRNYMKLLKTVSVGNIYETFSPYKDPWTGEYKISANGLRATYSYYKGNVFPLNTPFYKKLRKEPDYEYTDTPIKKQNDDFDVPEVPDINTPDIDTPETPF